MIGDETRREVASELRALDVSDIEVDGRIIDSPKYVGLLLMRMLEAVCDYRYGLHYFPAFFSAQAVLELFADLIDRPTCFDTESKDSNLFTCSACGFSESKLVLSPFTLSFRWCKPSYCYCPNCGAEVTEKEEDDG